MALNPPRKRKPRPNYFITDEEVGILWRFLQKRYGDKWSLMLAFALFRGLRIGEILAINMLDFNRDFTKVRVVLQKSHVEDWFPLIPELTQLTKSYITKNLHTLKGGYLFPFYSKRKKDHLSSSVAGVLMAKWRNELGKQYPQFLDRTNLYKEDGTPRLDSHSNPKFRYRVSWHSMRRWFETRLHDKLQDRKALADIMRYLNVSTVDVYINPYETWKAEQSILEGSLNTHIKALNMIGTGQRQLTHFLR